MKSNRFSCAGVACGLAFFLLLLVTGMSAQDNDKSAASHRGAPQDWTQGHIVFTRDGLAKDPEMIYREPRIYQQLIKRFQLPNLGEFTGNSQRGPLPPPTEDWTITALGGKLRPDMFPAKFTFDPTKAPDCINDYVAFGLAVPGATGGQANLVAFNNLYVGGATPLCPGTAPNLLFAYNITTLPGGKIVTSPIMSLDGTKIAFMESVPGGPGTGHAIFHVVTWHAGDGALGVAAAPPFMTSLELPNPGGTSITDSTSSPWLDYYTDIVYVGADNGYVYQITAATSGTPVLSAGNWPAATGLNYRLTSPILDNTRGLLMVGSSNGNLYQITTANGAVGSSPAIGVLGGTSSAIIAPPIVDVTNGTTFVIDANSGTSAVLVELDTFTDQPIATANIGIGATGGTKVKLYQPTFSNNYYTDPTGGFIATCGTGTPLNSNDTSPWAYGFGFSGRIMNATSPFVSFQLSTSTTDSCTGWTEFFNPNVGVGGTDFFFFGLTTDCTNLGTTGTGCVASVAYTGSTFIPNSVSVDGGPSGIVVDNYAIGASSIYFNSLSSNIAYKYTDELQ